MATQQTPPPPPPPPAKKKKRSTAAAPTTIIDLGDDLLREIFLRLPSLPSLVRAALACRAFLHAVRSSPAFRRRFRDIHPPHILGVFLDVHGSSMPAFVPIRRRSDPDHAAAVRGADVFLTRLPDDDDDAAPQWSVTDCRDGYFVLANFNTEQMAIYNPLTRAMDLFPIPPDEIHKMYSEFHVLFSEEDHESFRVVCVGKEKWGAQAAVLSSDTREWQVSPLGEDASTQAGDDEYLQHAGTLVNGFVYWTSTTRANACALNTATLQFSRIDLPPYMEGEEDYQVGQTKDGKLCMVCAVVLTLLVWVWRADEDGVHRWMLDKKFPLQGALDKIAQLDDHAYLKIVAIIDGFVYLSTFSEMVPDSPCWFLSFCLETEELNKLCAIIDSDFPFPYIMAWPPSLVRSKVNRRLEGASDEEEEKN